MTSKPRTDRHPIHFGVRLQDLVREVSHAHGDGVQIVGHLCGIFGGLRRLAEDVRVKGIACAQFPLPRRWERLFFFPLAHRLLAGLIMKPVSQCGIGLKAEQSLRFCFCDFDHKPKSRQLDIDVSSTLDDLSDYQKPQASDHLEPRHDGVFCASHNRKLKIFV